MKKYLIIAFAILLGLIAYQTHRIGKLKADRDTYRKNTEVLLGDVKHYKTKDSLNVASIGEISLKLSEFKKYRAEDMELIKTLKADKRNLQAVVSAQMETIRELELTPKDTIIYREDKEPYIAKAYQFKDDNLIFDALIGENDVMNAKFHIFVRVKYIEHIKRHRFLFIKWGVKERRQEILSLDPNTTVTQAEFITIRK